MSRILLLACWHIHYAYVYCSVDTAKMVITLVILLLQIVSCHTQDDPIVETIYGRIRGRIDTTEAGENII